MRIQDIINGCLLGDGSLRSQNNKYFSLKVSAKDKNFTTWLEKIFNIFDLRCWTTEENEGIFSLWFYINTCPYPEFLTLRSNWYTRIIGKPNAQKILPADLELTSTTLLFWYLGDGSLIRRKNDENRVPLIVFSSNCFGKKDIIFLKNKLCNLGLNFNYGQSYSGYNKGEKSGYVLYSSTADETVFKFFKLIGLQCPKEIANCSTGRKGIYHEEKFFRNKWPNEEDWIKILSNVKEIGPILREKRLQLNLSQNQFGRKVGMRRENIRDVELSKRHFRVKNFRKILNSLDLEPELLLNKLN